MKPSLFLYDILRVSLAEGVAFSKRVQAQAQRECQSITVRGISLGTCSQRKAKSVEKK
jgi:hypothetical protein